MACLSPLDVCLFVVFVCLPRRLDPPEQTSTNRPPPPAVNLSPFTPPFRAGRPQPAPCQPWPRSGSGAPGGRVGAPGGRELSCHAGGSQGRWPPASHRLATAAPAASGTAPASPPPTETERRWRRHRASHRVIPPRRTPQGVSRLEQGRARRASIADVPLNRPRPTRAISVV